MNAVASSSNELCSSLLKEASEKGYELEAEIVGQAKMLLLRFQQIEVKKELRTVCKFIPRGQIQEVVKKSVTFRVDPDLWMCKLARLLTERPEAELAILRSRGWLKMRDDNAFMRSLVSVQRFDLKRLGNREKKVRKLLFIFKIASVTLLTISAFGGSIVGKCWCNYGASNSARWCNAR